MFAYCLNNPVMLIDKSGQIPDSYAGGIGEDFGELIYEWLTGEEHPSKAAEEQEREIRQRQNKLIRDGTIALWDAYIHSIELEAEAQYQQDMMVLAHKEEVITGIVFTENASGAIAAYCGLAAAGLAVPTFGISIPTMGKIAAVAAAVSWLCDKLLELVNQ